ncbi:MAG: ABC-F family ATP-binding cassette domain-containing protein [Nitrospirota bacterium]|jgi:ATP-binding cassette subfamily F protein 3
MLSLQNVHKQFGGRVLYSGVSLRIEQGSRWGLVGPNGSGKTTLLGIITGEAEVDGGQVGRRRDLTVGYLRQEVEETGDAPLLVSVTGSQGEVAAIEARLAEVTALLSHPIADHDRLHALVEEQGHLFERFGHLGGFDLEARAERILLGLGFRKDDFPRPVSRLSGGWRMRAALARLLLAEPDILLLDEPTNHLDLAAVVWLEGYLREFAGAILLISHDRTFLNNLVHHVASVENAQVVAYKGNYDAFVQQQAERRAQLVAAKENQERKIRETERFIERFRAKATKARQVQSRVKQLDKIERIELEDDAATMRLRFPQPPRSGKVVVEIDGLAKHYGTTCVYDGLDHTIQAGQKIALVGPNGVGKSTFMKLLSGAVEPDAGTLRLGTNVTRAYFSQHSSETLTATNTILQEITAVAPDRSQSELRAILGAFLFTGDDVDKKIAVLSGGEKSRVALARLLVRPANFLLLDEPTNHLDMAARAVLERALHDYTGTLVLITHDRHLISAVVNHVLEIERDRDTPGAPARVQLYPGSYEAYRYAREQAEKEAAAASDAAEGPGNGAGGRERTDAKADRQAQREERRRLKNAATTLRREVERLEAEVEAAMAEAAGLAQRLADPDFYNQDPAAFADCVRRHEEAEERSAALTQQWEERLQALEAAEARLDEVA